MDFPHSSSAPANGITRIDLQPTECPIIDLTGHVHQLPCCINHNGRCPVADYFKPKRTGIVVDGLDVEEGSFRGRKLQGATLPIPEGYCGFVLERTNPVDESNKRKRGKGLEISEADSSCWEARAKFQNITYWNHDNLPCKDDALVRVFHWFAVANAERNVSVNVLDENHFILSMADVLFIKLHKPVTEDDLAASSKKEQKQ